MSRVIWKFKIDHEPIQLPIVSKFLRFESVANELFAWFEVDPLAPKEKTEFRVVATGQQILDDSLKYLGTALMMGGTFVWHLYSRVEAGSKE